jgi:deoxyribose-phosphate aldolase
MTFKITPEEMAKKIDQTNLKPDTTEEYLKKFFIEAKKNGFFSVAILPAHIKLAKQILKGSDVKIDTTAGFPLGSIPPELKEFEAAQAVEDGADEIDMVINNCALKSGKYDVVKKDVESVVRAADGRVVKVILEVPLLTREEVRKACEIAKGAGADFVKTSTGFSGLKKWRPTTVEDIEFLKKIVGKEMKVKAAGGIGTTKKAVAILKAGADRIGASHGVDIIKGLK